MIHESWKQTEKSFISSGALESNQALDSFSLLGTEPGEGEPHGVLIHGVTGISFTSYNCKAKLIYLLMIFKY